MRRREVGQDHAEGSTRRQKAVDSTQEAHGISNEVDRMRNLDHVKVAADLKILDLAYPGADADLPVKGQSGGVGINAFRVPAGAGEAMHRLPKPAGDVEEPAAPVAQHGRKKPVRS